MPQLTDKTPNTASAAKQQRGVQARLSGYAAEQLAETYLQQQGLRSVARNVRYKLGEIDLVMQDGDTLVFVEVKSRNSARFGGALASITPTKIRRLQNAIGLYTAPIKPLPPLRVDVVAFDSRQPNAAPLWLKNALG